MAHLPEGELDDRSWRFVERPDDLTPTGSDAALVETATEVLRLRSG